MVELEGSGDTLMLRPPNLLPVQPPGKGDGSGGSASGTSAGGSSGDGGEGGEGGGGGPSEDTVLLMLESMWRVSMLDIEATLRHACNKGALLSLRAHTPLPPPRRTPARISHALCACACCARLASPVLSDQSAGKEARKARARGLVLMGRIFQTYGSADALKTTDFAQHMQQVGEKMAEKAAEAKEAEANAQGQ